MSNSPNRDASANLRRDRGARRASAGWVLRSLQPTSEPVDPRLAQLLIDRADEFIGWLSPDGRLLYGNPALCRTLEYSQAEFSALHVWDISPRTPESWPARFLELKQQVSQTVAVELHTRSGKVLPARFNVNYATSDGEEFLLFGGRDLRETSDPVAGRLLEMHDEERRRIARELHDNTGQNLGALSINLSMILTTARIDPRTRQALKESLALAESCVREIRTISYLLHPPLLDELGLQSALRTYAEGYSERTGIQLDLDFPLPIRRLPPAVDIALFRIVQEGLANIHRHSGSRRATLRVRHAADRVKLELIDYGCGLDKKSASRIGVGIAGMLERARQLGGRLTIASGETGTTLRVILPVLQPQ